MGEDCAESIVVFFKGGSTSEMTLNCKYEAALRILGSPYRIWHLASESKYRSVLSGNEVIFYRRKGQSKVTGEGRSGQWREDSCAKMLQCESRRAWCSSYIPIPEELDDCIRSLCSDA